MRQDHEVGDDGWGERKRVARDERNATQMREETDRSWPGNDHPVDIAVNESLEASGENITAYRGVLEGMPDALERVAGRAGYEVPPGVGYIDRHGEQHLPWRIAVELARAFAAVEPTTVLLQIEITERKWEVQAREPGGSYLLGLLENYRAGWALVRQWASFDADRARLDKEVDRLRQLINRAVWDLRRPDADCERIAAQLDRGHAEADVQARLSAART